MPFGENGQHVTIRLIDFEDLRNNRFVVTRQYTYRAGTTEKRADIVLLVNGLPLVIIEAKTPVRSRRVGLMAHPRFIMITKKTFRNSLSRTSSQLQPKAKNIAMEASVYRSNIGGPGGWKKELAPKIPITVGKAVNSMLRPSVILDLLENFVLSTRKGKQRSKIIARYQQVEGANKIVHHN